MLRYTNHFESGLLDSQTLEKGFEAVRREASSGEVGYYHLPLLSQPLVEELKTILHDIDRRFNTIAIIGIGGSSLGIKAIERLLRPSTPNAKKLIYLENSDPISIMSEMKQIDKFRTLFIVISKSGGTVETLSIFKRLIVSFELPLENSDQIYVVSDEDSILAHFADDHHLRRFVIPSNVGGRFSVLSAVGMVPLTLAGFDTAAILKGAQTFLEQFWKREEDHMLEKAAYYVTHSDHYPMNVLFAYSDTFEEFGKWVVQIWGESLGKRNGLGERVGLTPISLIGSVDQHSFLQLIIEGPLNKTVTFMHIEHSEEHLMIPNLSLKHLEKSDFVNGKSFNDLINAQCHATMQSVLQSGVSVDEIAWKKIDEGSVGELILYYELLTSLSGALFGINTYDQPGVEIGKKILGTYFEK
ncbi:MAG: glucose-6-phosphate isomerase [Sulfuricurvum sp. GWF2_44_89]|uniref:Glucose-6-phosphate isomerase n=1 Tax=Sulfuricurvum kujiense TaxID=148813 RepID=A0A2D3WM91_9BACT|nr:MULTISPECIES: glucose-6-phosphate isomerase [Sulfuricurvum]OHD79301.1 MAG: glucose-6-phosphate isomerase [Sulfuricurvum sp. GWF2_44_89]OHD93067.1 MAG: glucose-6-phosphate isomerase [Sulfuricurvum sp. RIFOXYD12_FULL_44_77]OHD96388.1 MAG: glucose-6-phosphate isomerase [Sulfuricurvum sp. RIFOXYD2_FULL_44_160]DAB37673.1 MAG TPA: glucose-6-phosphate isomerase [Sulfuricurvum kujiense]